MPYGSLHPIEILNVKGINIGYLFCNLHLRKLIIDIAFQRNKKRHNSRNNFDKEMVIFLEVREMSF